MSNAEKFIAALRQMNKEMKAEMKAGKKWKYSNSSAKQENTFDKAISKNKRYVNCALGVHWGLIRSGLVPVAGTGWWGVQGGKIQWKNSTSKKEAKKYLQIIAVQNKTVKQCIKDKTLKSGDVVTYVSMTHTNVYLGQVDGKSQWFDAGHATCTASGELAPFRAAGWIIKRSYDSYKIGYILRLKETSQSAAPAPTPTPAKPASKIYYRVRLGIYSAEANAKLKCANMAELKVDTFYEKKPDGWYVYAGSYTTEAAAEARKAEFTKMKIPSEIEEHKVS